jgi:hypothetical protein
MRETTWTTTEVTIQSSSKTTSAIWCRRCRRNRGKSKLRRSKGSNYISKHEISIVGKDISPEIQLLIDLTLKP